MKGEINKIHEFRKIPLKFIKFSEIFSELSH